VQGGALVHVYTDGSVLVAHGGTEMGQGLFTKVIQVAAQCFGIPESFIVTTESATNTVPNASPSAASLSSDLYGMAVLDACEKIRDRLAPMRAKMPDADWPTLVKSAYFERIDLSAHGFYTINTERCGFDFDKKCATNAERGFPLNYFTMGVACTEVEIDCLTGDSYVLRADVLMDVGKSINPAIDIGQIEGAWIQGFGWSTMEELIWGDKEHAWVRPGQLFTRGPGTYKIPSFNDVPADFRVHLSDTDNRFAIHSSKAVGEPPFFMGASALFAIKVRHGLNSSFSWVFMLTLRSFPLVKTGCHQRCASRERLHGVLPAEPAGDLRAHPYGLHGQHRQAVHLCHRRQQRRGALSAPGFLLSCLDA
jgi:xanthine dehydrogenase/oxidase